MQPSNPARKIDFAKVEELRRSLLMSVEDMATFFGVKRQTYYKWLNGGQPRQTNFDATRGQILLLLKLLQSGWPSSQAIAAKSTDRYALLLEAVRELE